MLTGTEKKREMEENGLVIDFGGKGRDWLLKWKKRDGKIRTDHRG